MFLLVFLNWYLRIQKKTSEIHCLINKGVETNFLSSWTIGTWLIAYEIATQGYKNEINHCLSIDSNYILWWRSKESEAKQAITRTNGLESEMFEFNVAEKKKTAQKTAIHQNFRF